MKGAWDSGEEGMIDTLFDLLFPIQAHVCCIVGASWLVGVRRAILGQPSHGADIFASRMLCADGLLMRSVRKAA